MECGIYENLIKIISKRINKNECHFIFLIIGEKFFGKTEMLKELYKEINIKRKKVAVDYTSEIKELPIDITIENDNDRKPIRWELLFYIELLYTFQNIKPGNILKILVKAYSAKNIISRYVEYPKFILMVSSLLLDLRMGNKKKCYLSIVEMMGWFNAQQKRFLKKEIEIYKLNFYFLFNAIALNKKDADEFRKIKSDHSNYSFIIGVRPTKENLYYWTEIASVSGFNVETFQILPEYKLKMPETIYDINPPIIKKVMTKDTEIPERALIDIIISDPYYSNIYVDKLSYKVYNYDLGKQVSEDKIYQEISVLNLDNAWKQKIERMNDSWRRTVKSKKPKDLNVQIFNILKKIIIKKQFNVQQLYNVQEYPDWEYLINLLIEKNLIELKEDNCITITQNGFKYFNDLALKHPKGVKSSPLKTKVGVLATGSKVQEWDGVFDNLIGNGFDRKTIALDMESYAFAKLAHFRKIPFLIAKAVGDYAKNGKGFSNRYIEYSSASSYRFIVEFSKLILSDK